VHYGVAPRIQRHHHFRVQTARNQVDGCATSLCGHVCPSLLPASPQLQPKVIWCNRPCDATLASCAWRPQPWPACSPSSSRRRPGDLHDQTWRSMKPTTPEPTRSTRAYTAEPSRSSTSCCCPFSRFCSSSMRLTRPMSVASSLVAAAPR
jgi:hypothetical protein